ncbi:hypothetical protein HOY80DRAFT_15299 [Tuber brumale]|nr:hypothetical protein HOY80DRAFT_15299 [Tuber brumale]
MLKHSLRQSPLRRPLLLLSTSTSSSTPLLLHPSAPTPTPRKSSTHHHQPSYFAASIPTPSQSSKDHTPPSERSINLGRTIQTLRSHLPTLLQTPLPLDILSPSITLNLFPSTHPHLPAVRGRVAYVAALWTAPVAWGRLPGRNRRLEVLSERMLREGQGEGEEVFVVRWRMCEEEEFCGIFLFEFDDVGRVGRHVIEEVMMSNWLEIGRKDRVTPLNWFSLSPLFFSLSLCINVVRSFWFFVFCGSFSLPSSPNPNGLNGWCS